MDELSQFSSLVGNIYDASLNPTLWHDVLADIADFVGGQSAGIGLVNPATRSLSPFCTFGCDPHYLKLQIDEYVKCDPAGMLYFYSPEQVVSMADLMPYDQYLETRFFQEWARPQGWADSINVVLEKSPTKFSFLGVYRNENIGPADEVALRRMRLIMPYVRRAMAVGEIIEQRTVDATALADTLDGLSAGMFLVNGRGHIVHANARAHAMLAERSPLYSVSGKLAVRDANAEKRLCDELLAAGQGDRAVGASSVPIPLTSESGADYVAYVLPLNSAARRGAYAAYTAVATVFVHKAELRLPSSPEVIARTFKLTSSELRVLLTTVDVGSVPNVAEVLGVSGGTVKTHLKRIYAKTHTNSQRELMKLILGFSGHLS